MKLVVNHTSIVSALLLYCGIPVKKHKEIFELLADFNAKLTKSLVSLFKFKFQVLVYNKLEKQKDASKENRANWFKDRLPKFELSEHSVEKLLNFLLKSGEPEKVLSELRTLTKSESSVSIFTFSIKPFFFIWKFSCIGGRLCVVCSNLNLLHIFRD